MFKLKRSIIPDKNHNNSQGNGADYPHTNSIDTQQIFFLPPPLYLDMLKPASVFCKLKGSMKDLI